jgi:hypothetical protein
LIAKRSVNGKVKATEERILEQVGFELRKEDLETERSA